MCSSLRRKKEEGSVCRNEGPLKGCLTFAPGSFKVAEPEPRPQQSGCCPAAER